jgi:hypothetical protein
VLGSDRASSFSIPESQRKLVLPRIQPMRLRLIKQAFDNPEYLFELKHDGLGAFVYLVWSKNSNELK